jgi:cell wall assembly regulator SMI1
MSSEDAVVDAWKRIEAWSAKHFPALAQTLCPGASEGAISEVEAATGPLPAAFRTSISRHDGQRDFPALFWFKDTYRLLSLEEIREERTGRAKATKEAIPIAKAKSGDLMWLRIADGDGPIRVRAHDAAGVPTVASSFESYLATLASDLDAGRYREDEYGGLDRKLPSGPDREALVATLARRVFDAHGGVADLRRAIAAEVNQPEWIVSWGVADDDSLEFALLDLDED